MLFQTGLIITNINHYVSNLSNRFEHFQTVPMGPKTKYYYCLDITKNFHPHSIYSIVIN